MIHMAMLLWHLPSGVSFTSSLIMFKLIDTQTILTSTLQHESSYGLRVVFLLPWIIFSTNITSPPHQIPYQVQHPCSNTWEWTPRPLSSVSPKVILHRTESPSGGSNRLYNYNKYSFLFYRQQRLMLWEMTGTASTPAAQLWFSAQSHTRARLAVKPHDNQK